MKKFDEIIDLLDTSGFEYELIQHKPAVTSEEAERFTGWPLTAGAKSILFRADKKFYLFIVKGSNRVDFKKLRKILGARKARLATPDEVLEVMGVEVGACYPFPDVAGVEGFVDETLADNEKVSFSPGTHTDHIRMNFKDYIEVTKPKLVDLAISADEV